MSADTPTTATYIYCVVQSSGAPDLSGAPPGLPGTGPLRAVLLKDSLWLIAADAPLSAYSSEAIDARLSDLNWVGARAMAHEQVVEHCAAAHPAVPMKLFTLFSSDRRAAETLGARREAIGRALARTAGRVEWGVRILFQEERARQTAAPSRPAEAPASGKSFLLRKKMEQDSARTAVSRALAEAGRVFDGLAAHAAAARRREPAAETPGVRLLLDAAFLVPQEGGESFEQEVRMWAGRLEQESCELTLTGPWPPYNFIEEPA